MTYPLVVVEWTDHCSSHEWFDSPQEALEVCTVAPTISTGYLIHEDDLTYLICMNIAPQNYSGTMRILKATTSNIRRIEGEVVTP